MRNIRCDEILNKSEYLKLPSEDFEKQVEYYLLDKMNEYETTPSKSMILAEKPEKKYEIFNLVFDTGEKKNKIFVLDTNLINYDEDIDDKELYYSRIIAKRICDNMKILTEDAIFGVSEAESEFEDKIEEIKNKIKELKEQDENEYNLDLFASVALEGTPIVKDLELIQKQNIDVLRNNEELKDKLKKAENQVLNLSNKLKISLDEIEKIRKNTGLNTQSRFEKLVKKIKGILG